MKKAGRRSVNEDMTYGGEADIGHMSEFPPSLNCLPAGRQVFDVGGNPKQPVLTLGCEGKEIKFVPRACGVQKALGTILPHVGKCKIGGTKNGKENETRHTKAGKGE